MTIQDKIRKTVATISNLTYKEGDNFNAMEGFKLRMIDRFYGEFTVKRTTAKVWNEWRNQLIYTIVKSGITQEQWDKAFNKVPEKTWADHYIK